MANQSNMPKMKILHMYVDIDCEDSFFHLLINDRHFKYISIEADVYSVAELSFPPCLLSMLPPLPFGYWNLGHISKSKTGAEPHLEWTMRKSFPGIIHTWHPVLVDYLSLHIEKTVLSNVYEATCPSPNPKQAFDFLPSSNAVWSNHRKSVYLCSTRLFKLS